MNLGENSYNIIMDFEGFSMRGESIIMDLCIKGFIRGSFHLRMAVGKNVNQ